MIEYVIFLYSLAHSGGCKRNEIWYKSILGDEDDAQTLNTCIAQRKRAIPHLTMKHKRNIMECCNNTHQGAPHTGKQTCACTSDLGDASHITSSIDLLLKQP